MILFFISAVITLGFLLPALECICDAGCRADNDLEPTNEDEAQNLEETCDNEDDIRLTYILSVVTGALGAALQCAGFLYGRKLALHSYFHLVPAIPAGQHVPTAHPVSAAGSAPVHPAGHSAQGQLYGAQFASHNAQAGYPAPPGMAGGQGGGGYPPAAHPEAHSAYPTKN